MDKCEDDIDEKKIHVKCFSDINISWRNQNFGGNVSK